MNNSDLEFPLMKDNKENINTKLDKIKTDLEIRLVKMELQKLKVKEDDLVKSTELDDELLILDDEITETDAVLNVENKVSKSTEEIQNTEVTVKFEKEEKVKTTPKSNSVSKDVTTKKNVKTKTVSLNTKKPIKPVSKVKKVTKKKEVLLKKSNKTDSKTSKKATKNKVSAYTAKRVIAKKKPKVKEKNNSKTKLIVAFIIIIVLLFALRKVYNLKEELNSKEQQLIISKEEEENQIDLDEKGYFKEVEDDVAEEDLQDFNEYKDIPELVVKNTKKSKVTKPKVLKSINRQIRDAKRIIPVPQNNNLQSQNENTTSTNTQTKDLTNIKKAVVKEEKDDGENAANKVSSDFIKIVGLQLVKGGKYIIPKKAKKTNSFSVRIRLNKFKRKTTGSEVEIMLVIKDPQGKTLKIDVKKVDFGERKVIYLTFYETIKDKLEINKNYTFSVFADKVLIKNANKLI